MKYNQNSKLVYTYHILYTQKCLWEHTKKHFLINCYTYNQKIKNIRFFLFIQFLPLTIIRGKLFISYLPDENWTVSPNFMTRLLNRADSLDFSNVINLRFEKSTFKSLIFKLNSDTEHHNSSVDGFLIENKIDNLSLHSSNLFKIKLNSTESPKLKQLSRSLNSLSRINNSFTVDK